MVYWLYSCSRCTYETTDRNDFNSHLDNTHSRETSHWCRRCGKLFHERSDFLEHQEGNRCSRSFEYDHPCGFEGCQFSDRDPTRFIFHFKNMHRGKPLLPCVYCKRLFTIPSCLIAHIQEECCNRPSSSSASAATSRPPTQPSEGTLIPATENSKAGSSRQRSKSFANGDDNSDLEGLSWVPLTFSQMPPQHEGLKMVIDSDSDSTVSTCSTASSIQGAGSSFKRKSSEACFAKPTKWPKLARDMEVAEGVRIGIKDWKQWTNKLGCKINIQSDERIRHFFKCVAKGCQFSTNKEWDFAHHVNKKHGKDVPMCCYCFVKFTSGDRLARHMLECHAQRMFQCSCCLFRACSEKHVKEHQIAAHANLTPLILACGNPSAINVEFEEKTPAKLKDHKTFKCGSCNFRTLLMPDIVDHYRRDHPNILLFECSFCNFGDPQMEALFKHFETHGIQDYECDYCLFGAKKAADVVLHLCINHADEKLQYLNRLWPSGESIAESPAKVSSTTVTELPEPLFSPDPSSVNTALVAAESSTGLPCRIQLFQDDSEIKHCRPSTDHSSVNNSASRTKSGLAKERIVCNSSIDSPPSSPSQVSLNNNDHLELELSSEEDPGVEENPTVLTSSDESRDLDDSGRIDETIPEIQVDEQTKHQKSKTIPPKEKETLKQNLSITLPSTSRKSKEVPMLQKYSTNSENEITDKISPQRASPRKVSKKKRISSQILQETLGTRLDNSDSKDKYQCSLCDKTFCVAKSCSAHLANIHNISELFQCSLCTYKSNTRLNVLSHSKVTHPGAKYSIKDLFLSVVKPDNPAPIVQANKYVCVFCNHYTEDEVNMTRHVLAELHYFKFCCTHCNFRARDLMTVVHHCRKIHPLKSEEVKAKNDSYLEEWAKEYVGAQKKDFQLEGNACSLTKYDYNIGVNHCGICELALSSEAVLRGHLFHHLQYKPFKCDICAERFSTTTDFDSHHELEHGKEPKKRVDQSIRIIEDWVNGVISLGNLLKLNKTNDLMTQNNSSLETKKDLSSSRTLESEVFPEASSSVHDLTQQKKRDSPPGKVSPKKRATPKHAAPLNRKLKKASISPTKDMTQKAADTILEPIIIDLSDKAFFSGATSVRRKKEKPTLQRKADLTTVSPSDQSPMFDKRTDFGAETSNFSETTQKGQKISPVTSKSSKKSHEEVSIESQKQTRPQPKCFKATARKTINKTLPKSSSTQNVNNLKEAFPVNKMQNRVQRHTPGPACSKPKNKARKSVTPSNTNPKENFSVSNFSTSEYSPSKGTARKSVSQPLSSKSQSQHLLSKSAAKHSAIESKSHSSQLLPIFHQPASKSTARKSTSKPARIPRSSPVGSGRYGCKPLPANLESIFILTKPPGYECCIKLSGFYVRDMFRRKARVVLHDYRTSLLLL